MKHAEHIERSWTNHFNFKLLLQKNKKSCKNAWNKSFQNRFHVILCKKSVPPWPLLNDPAWPVALWPPGPNFLITGAKMGGGKSWQAVVADSKVPYWETHVHKNIWIQYQYYIYIYTFIYKLSLESRCFQNFTPGLRISESESLMRNSTETLKHWFCWCWNYLSWTQTHSQPHRKSAKSKWT